MSCLWTTATPYRGEPIGLMTKGEAIVDIMNATGYDIAIPGNHEFDYGFFQDETGEGVYGAVKAAVDGARGDGADYVVVMGHMGDEAEVIPWTYADVIAHTSGIDAWLDGHSHDAEQVVMKNALGQPVYRSACGSRNENIGVLTIRVDGTIRTELFKWSSSLSAPRLLGLKNPATEAVARAGELLDERMSATIASTEAALVINEPGGKLRDGKPVRLIQNTQTNLGDLCADAYLDHFEDADVAIVNGSGIRSDIPSGAITMNDIMRTLPYGTKLDLVKVTGQQLLDILEWSVHAMPEEFGGFEHVAGLTYEVDLAVPTPCVEDKQKMFVAVNEGMPRRVGNVRVGGEPIDAQAEYRLVTNDYILVDGDGFTMFRQADVLEGSDAADSEALLEYITVTLNSLVGEAYADPYGQGRMVTVGDQAG